MATFAWGEILPELAGHQVAVPIEGSDQLAEIQSLMGPEVFSAGLDQRHLVEASVRYFSRDDGHAWLDEGIRKAEPFRDFIISWLSANHMPQELYYVAMIESTFEIKAVSSSGAAGLWQFMLNSIGNWMHNNEWVDERYDFWASTRGALEKLRDNYREFGDWSLALAAYNAGSGKIGRLVKKNKATNFWELLDDPELPLETRSYVPRILAAAYIGSHAIRNDLPIFWDSPIEWCKVGIKRPVRLSRLEEAAGMPRGVLKIGNAELRYDLTPPEKLHYLKVPRKFVDDVVVALKNDDLMFDYTRHVVVKGDTLYSLSRSYQTSITLITRYNPGLNLEHLRIGEKLIIPLVPSRISAELPIKGVTL